MRSVDDKMKFVELRASGMSYRKIAEETGISRETLRKWNNELQDEIEAEKGERILELKAAFSADHKSKLERLARILQRRDAAIDSADFSQMPPDKLLTCRAIYAANLEKALPEAPKVDKIAGFTEADLEDLKSRISAGCASVAEAERAAAINKRLKDAKSEIKNKTFDDIFSDSFLS